MTIHLSELLKKQIDIKNIYHAYIFETNKSDQELLAREFYSSINSYFENDDFWIDFHLIRSNKNNISIDRIRELKKDVYDRPLISKISFHVILESELMKKEAQNALLKTLEDTPSYATIILLTENVNRLEATIKSRCQICKFTSDEKKEMAYILDILHFINYAIKGDIYRIVTLKDYMSKVEDKLYFVKHLSFIFEYAINIKYNICDDELKIKKFIEPILLLSDKKIEDCVNKIDQMISLSSVNVNLQLALEDFLFTFVEDR